MIFSGLVGHALLVLVTVVGIAFVFAAGIVLLVLWFSLRSERDG